MFEQIKPNESMDSVLTESKKEEEVEKGDYKCDVKMFELFWSNFLKRRIMIHVRICLQINLHEVT